MNTPCVCGHFRQDHKEVTLENGEGYDSACFVVHQYLSGFCSTCLCFKFKLGNLKYLEMLAEKKECL